MEVPPKKTETKEGERTGAFEALRNRIASLSNTLKERGATDGSTVSAETRQKIFMRAGRLSKIAGLAGAVAAMATSGHEIGRIQKAHADSRYEITETLRPDGTVEYQHEDPETDRIMDYLTGAGELSPEDRVIFLRQLVFNKFVRPYQPENSDPQIDPEFRVEAPLPLPENLDSLSEAELREHLIAHNRYFDELSGESMKDGKTVEQRTDEEIARFLEPSVDYDPQFEQVLWELQQRSGAPRIRWASPSEHKAAVKHSREGHHGRAFYVFDTNTIYLEPGAEGSSLLAENAHAVQFGERPFSTRAWGEVDYAIIRIRAVLNGQTVYEAQQDEYDREGSLEHTAHSIIEGKLVEELGSEILRREDEADK